MTTIIITKDFVASDRRLTSDGGPAMTACKLFTGNGWAAAASGNWGAVSKWWASVKDKSFSDAYMAGAPSESNSVIVCKNIVYYGADGGFFEIDLNPAISSGSGGSVALGVINFMRKRRLTEDDLSKVYKAVASVDAATSKDFDIIYRRDLISVVAAPHIKSGSI